ncbi:hypothetical protein MBLNU230_g3088t1 [Neophaeotheca triangularis]
MSPNGSIAASQLRQLIFYHIDNDFLDNANFLAGRLHAMEPRNPDGAHLLALTYLRLRRHKAAYDAAHKYGSNGRHLGCAFVFAQACLNLKRSLEGATALDKARAQWRAKNHFGKHSDSTRRHLPDAAAANTLLGKLWEAHGDMRKAGDCYIEAHKANPFIWDAFDGLCKIGADLNIPNMFKATVELSHTTSTSFDSTVPEVHSGEAPATLQPLTSNTSFTKQPPTRTEDPFAPSREATEEREQGPGSFALPKVKSKGTLANTVRSEWDTPTGNSAPFGEDTAMGGVTAEDVFQPPPAPARRTRMGHHSEATSERPRRPDLRTHSQASTDNSHDQDNSQNQRMPGAAMHKRTASGQVQQANANTASDPSAPPRRSNRLFGQGTSTRSTRATGDSTASIAGQADRQARAAKPATGTRGRMGSTVGRVVSGNRKVLPPADKEKPTRAPSRNSEKSAAVPNPAAQKYPAAPLYDFRAEQEALASLLTLFKTLAQGYYNSVRFDTASAIATFRGLPTAQRDSPWVMQQLGRAYYEASDYPAARDAFARSLKLQPSDLTDMEIYSTVLWHLKAETPLAYLCHLLRDQDFLAPETWCSLGNAFSLSREHDQAISAFKRATQLNPNFAYAYTLMGHEHIANEDYDAALTCFRQTVALDRRSYGGWYGLGKSYERMSKLEQAEHHYRIAAALNPSNATLLVCIGVVLERQRNRKAALTHYTRALEISPSSALARFKKARVLMHVRAYAEALEELERLRDQAPDEANVWFLLGKCYKGLGGRSEALRAFTTALNLDVKAAPFIKEAMEALDEDDEEASSDEE